MKIDIKNLVYQNLGAGDFKRFDKPNPEKELLNKFNKIKQQIISLIKENGGKNIKEGSNRYELVFDIDKEKAPDLIEKLKNKNIRIMSEYQEKEIEVEFNMPVLEVKAYKSELPPELSSLPKGKYFYGYAGKSIPDAQGDLILPEAYQKAAKQITKAPYNKVFLGHEYKDIPIGIVVHAEPKDDGLLIVARLNENHERAEEVWKSIQEGYLDGFSLGGKFIRKSPEWDEKAGRYINKVHDIQVREISLTGIPANKEALVMQAFQKAMDNYDKEKVKMAKAILDDMEQKAPEGPYLNPDGSFKGGFEGCVKYFQATKGLSKERASALCAYIGRRTGKIKEVKPDEVNVMTEEKQNVEGVETQNNLEDRVKQLEAQIDEIKKMLEKLSSQEVEEEAEKMIEENKANEKKSIKVEEKKFAEIEKKSEVSFLDWLKR